MYYKSVNRGLSLTAPGFYTIALVLTMGLMAIGSGYNAIYLSLSLGMAILIISGLLSEKVMKNFKVRELRKVTAEPHTPFMMHLQVENTSNELFLYGIENVLVNEIPKLSTFSTKIPYLMKSTVMVLEPGAVDVVAGQCQGLSRGIYREFNIIQRTVYPFGLLTKFKISQVKTQISILPEFKEALAVVLRAELQRRISGRDQDREFHSHRGYLSSDPIRYIDWKKSAGRLPQEWVLKEYESQVDEFGVLLEPDWDGIIQAPDDIRYEAYISRLRTACDVVNEVGRKVALIGRHHELVMGYENVIRLLVGTPTYTDRKNSEVFNVEDRMSGNFLRLKWDFQGNHRWDTKSLHLTGL